MQLYSIENHLNANDKFIGKLMEAEKTKVMQLQLRAGAVVPAHQTDADVLIIVQKGRGIFDFQGKQIEVSAEKLLYILPQETHSVHALEDLEMLVIRTER